MESQPQNPEFRINPENFHPCKKTTFLEQKYGQEIFFLPHVRTSSEKPDLC